MSDDEDVEKLVALLGLVDYIDEHAGRIYIRAVGADGKYASLSLLECSNADALKFFRACIIRWIQDPNYQPVRVLDEPEGP